VVEKPFDCRRVIKKGFDHNILCTQWVVDMLISWAFLGTDQERPSRNDKKHQ